MSTAANIVIALPLVFALVALIVGYGVWRNRRRADDAEQADQEAQKGGGGGPKPVK